MNYQITITKTEPNPNFEAELKQWRDRLQWGGFKQDLEPRRDFIKDALIVELTEEQYKAVKAAVFKTFE